MRQTPRSTTTTASSGPGSAIEAPHSRPRSTSSSPPRPEDQEGPGFRPAATAVPGAGPRRRRRRGRAAGRSRGAGGVASRCRRPRSIPGRRPLRPAPARRVRQSGSQRASLGPRLRPMPARLHRPRQRGDRARRTGRRIVARVRLPRPEQCGSGTRPAAAACTSSPVMLTGCGCWPSVPTGRGWLPPATTALYGDGTRRPAPPARPDGKPDARRNEKSAACRRRLTCPELISPSSHSGEDGFRRLVHPDRICRHRSPGNGDGQRPNPGISGCSQ